MRYLSICSKNIKLDRITTTRALLREGKMYRKIAVSDGKIDAKFREFRQFRADFLCLLGQFFKKISPAMSHVEERNHDNTVFVGSLDQSVDEALLWELMIQVGPVGTFFRLLELPLLPTALFVAFTSRNMSFRISNHLFSVLNRFLTAVSVYMPRDKSFTKEHQGFGFVEFQSETDVDYACKVMNGVMLFNQPIRVNRSGRDRKLFDIGANLFIGNLDPEVDERHLTETFKHFGSMITPAKLSRDDTSGMSKGFAFVYYDTFEAADAAIAAMNGQFFGGRRISVNYSFKKDKPGERHGDTAERMLAAKNPMAKVRKEISNVAPGLAAAPPAATPPPFGMPPPVNMGAPGMSPHQPQYQGGMAPPYASAPPPFIPGQTAPAGMGAPPPYGYSPQQHQPTPPGGRGGYPHGGYAPNMYPPPHQYAPSPYGNYQR